MEQRSKRKCIKEEKGEKLEKGGMNVKEEKNRGKEEGLNGEGGKERGRKR